MNEKFYTLPREKQERMLNAGFRVFSRAPYKKCPMQEIADSAGISKGLLFHYFHNKRELYLFLWERSVEITREALERCRCYDPDDLFLMMERGMRAKLEVMRVYPDMTAFVIRAFYEKDPEIREQVQASYHRHFAQRAQTALAKLDDSAFIPGLDISRMYREMYLASEGYLWEIYHRDEALDVDRLEADFEDMLSFWRQIYLRKDK